MDIVIFVNFYIKGFEINLKMNECLNFRRFWKDYGSYSSMLQGKYIFWCNPVICLSSNNRPPNFYQKGGEGGCLYLFIGPAGGCNPSGPYPNPACQTSP